VTDINKLETTALAGIGSGDRLVPGTMSQEEADAIVAVRELAAHARERDDEATGRRMAEDEREAQRARAEAAEADRDRLAEINRELVATHNANLIADSRTRDQRDRYRNALEQAQHWHEQLDYDEALNVIDSALATPDTPPATDEQIDNSFDAHR
jgi:hypothetical protein